MCPFQNGSSTSGILNKSTVSAKFTCDDLCGESESYWERVIWWYFARIKCGNIVPGCLWIVFSVPRTWLIVWFPEVMTGRFQVRRGARAIKILRTSQKKCFVSVQLKWFCLSQPILSSRKVDSRSVLVGHPATSLIFERLKGQCSFHYKSVAFAKSDFSCVSSD